MTDLGAAGVAVVSEISLFLLRKVVTVVAFVFDLPCYPIEQQSNY